MANEGISPLKKVTLTFAMPSSHDPSGSGGEHNFTFIYGAASGGLCPFEIALANKLSGEILSLDLSQEDIHDFFGHLFMPVKKCLRLQILPQQLSLGVAVSNVEKAGDHEIITAMKNFIGGCGGGCDCGCH